MIELIGNRLRASFPEVHADAVCEVEFQRTLRIPDDGRQYPLPAGMGAFPLHAVEDYSVPDEWKVHGGVFFPMYQSEAMWLNFRVLGDYPFAVKVAAGKINAVTGEPWTNALSGFPQDYLTIPAQPWLDGFCVSKGMVRQFVASGLGDGHTVEEQLTGKAEWGGLQLIFYPMKAGEYRKRFELPRQIQTEIRELAQQLGTACEMLNEPFNQIEALIAKQQARIEELDRLSSMYAGLSNWQGVNEALENYKRDRLAVDDLRDRWGRSFLRSRPAVFTNRSEFGEVLSSPRRGAASQMGLAGGGLIRQEIAKDDFGLDVWDVSSASRCFVHLLNSESFEAVTARKPPTKPVSAEDYKRAGIPWFDYYLDKPAVGGSSVLAGVASLGNSMAAKGQMLKDNAPIQVGHVINLKSENRVVQDGEF